MSLRAVALVFSMLAMSCSSFGTTSVDAQEKDAAPGAPDGGDTPSPSTYAGEVLADEPLAYWRLDDQVLKSTTRSEIAGTDATVLGAPQLGAPHPLKGEPKNIGFAFNGDQKDALDAGARFDFAGREPFTLEAWALFTDIDDDYRHIFTKDDYPAGRHEYGLFVQRGYGLQFERIVADVKIDATAPLGMVKLGTWHHVVATYSGEELALWMNGGLVEKKPDARPQASKPVPLFIGRKNQVGGALKGNLDEIAIYGRVLPDARIKRHYDVAVGN